MSTIRAAVLGYDDVTLRQLYHNLDQAPQCRSRLSAHMLKTWWPGHDMIFIDSFEVYEKIEQHLDQCHGPVLIAQTEEDWFMALDWHDVRNRIRSHPRWNDECMIISNSRWDCDMLTAVGIRNQCKPGLLDLMTYRELPEVTWQRDLIQHHTSVMFAHLSWPGDMSRIRLCELLMENQARVGCIAGEFMALDNQAGITAQCVLPTPIDSPDSPLSADLYLRTIAFSTVLETQYRGHWCPTTSEKTYRCFHNQVPALVCGGQHTRRYLLGLGFDPCDWLFDWSWDIEPEPGLRFQGFLNEVQRLLNQPLEQIKVLIEQHQSSLVHNQHTVRRLICGYQDLDNRPW